QRGIAVERGAQRDTREWRKLLDSHDCDLGGRLALLGADQIDVDLAAAQHQAADVLGAASRFFVVDDRLEAAGLELDWRRRNGRMTQQALWRQHEQRKRIFLEELCLTSQQVEVLRGGRAV